MNQSPTLFRNNTINGILSIFQNQSSKRFNNNSSNNDGGSSDDDDDGSSVEDPEYISKGNSGIKVFCAYCKTTNKSKTFHVHIYTGLIVQYSENKRKKYYCNDISNIITGNDGSIIIERKKNGLSTSQKRYIFNNDSDAQEFKNFILNLNDIGSILRSAFDAIDGGQKLITISNLRAALARVDLTHTEDDLVNMLRLNDNGKTIDFQAFFNLFMETQVSNLRECLQEWLYQARLLEEVNDFKGSGKFVKVAEIINLLPGEVLALDVLERIHWCVHVGKASGPMPLPGALHITNYRLIFNSMRKTTCKTQTRHSRYDIPNFFQMTSLPLCSIIKVQLVPPKNYICIYAKDYRVIRISLSSANQSRAEFLVHTLNSMAFRFGLSSTQFFAYKLMRTFDFNGWKFNNMLAEYKRQGITERNEWKIYDNSNYSLCDTYPTHVVVPSKMSDIDLKVAAEYRSKRRLPAVTYMHRSSGAVLTRSAQPLVGLTFKNCSTDVTLLNLYRNKGMVGIPKEYEQNIPPRFYILDARRQIAATLNMAAGKGTEDASMYNNTELIFGNIDNVHVMRQSANLLADLLLPGGYNVENAGGSGFYAKLEESGWLKHTRLILAAGNLVAEKLHLEKTSVLIHCSDGWDRTSQICSIAQFILDPYFRTLEGLAVLIEKDWLAFGHKYHDRCGHGEDTSFHPDERSPVFLQFLDCLVHLLSQFPTAIEFNENLLMFLADHVNSCLFGTFLCNSDKQRREARVIEETQSIWSYVFSNKSRFINPDYIMYNAGPLWINTQIGKMNVWERYFSRWDSEAHPNLFSKKQWHDDWGCGYETKIDNHDIERSLYKYVGSNDNKKFDSDFDNNNVENTNTELMTVDSTGQQTLEYNPSESDDKILIE